MPEELLHRHCRQELFKNITNNEFCTTRDQLNRKVFGQGKDNVLPTFLFKVINIYIIPGYISAIYQFLCEECDRVAPGSTPVRRRRRDSSQSQSSQIARQRAKRGESEPLTVEVYARELIKGELTQRLFALTQKIHKKLPEHVRHFHLLSLLKV